VQSLFFVLVASLQTAGELSFRWTFQAPEAERLGAPAGLAASISSLLLVASLPTAEELSFRWTFQAPEAERRFGAQSRLAVLFSLFCCREVSLPAHASPLPGLESKN
jgi:membrane protease YdiL (CAAX protease family)